MGSSGLKREGRRRLPKVPDDAWSDGDVLGGPLFGQFRWGAYTPAGSLERSAWFYRQVRRNGTREGWKWGFDFLRMFGPLIIWIVCIGFVISVLVKEID